MKWVSNILIAYKPKFKYPSSYSAIHISYTNMKHNTDSYSSPMPPPFWDSLFFWFNSSSNTSLLLWNVPTVRFLPLFSSWRTPLFLSQAVYPMHMQYLLTSSTFPLFHLLLPSYFMNIYLSLFSPPSLYCYCKPFPSVEWYEG